MAVVGWEEALLFLVGVILVIVEIFFIPGFGVPGVLGLICVITALVLSLVAMPIDVNRTEVTIYTQLPEVFFDTPAVEG